MKRIVCFLLVSCAMGSALADDMKYTTGIASINISSLPPWFATSPRPTRSMHAMWRSLATSCLAFTLCLVLMGCNEAEPRQVASLKQLLSESDLYDGKLVSVEACLFATEHGIGVISCQYDKSTLIELDFSSSARANEVARSDFGPIDPSFPMTVTGRFTAREGMGLLTLESAVFHARGGNR